MGILDRQERRFGRYALQNITLWLIAGQVIVFIGQFMQPAGANPFAVIDRLALDPQRIYEGQVWRLLSFIFIAPLSIYPIFVIFFWWLFYLMGTTLEVTWGAFRYGVFIAMGFFASIAAAFIADFFAPGAGYGTGDFLYGSVFLAFARFHPNFQIFLFFLLPIAIKWLALLQWIGYGFGFIFGDWHTRLMIVAATVNYLFFFGRDIWLDIKQGRRRMIHQAKTLKQPTRVMHECRTCGVTSEMAPKMQFRYCSQCAGSCCYCPDHLKDHEHVVE